VTTANTYSVTVTGAAPTSCADTTVPGTTVTVNPLPTPVIGETCGDPFSTLDAGAGYLSYSWTSVPGGLPGDGETTQTIQVDCNTAGSYTVTVEDANNCFGTSPAEDVSNCTCGAVIPQPEPALTMNIDGTQHIIVPHDAATTQYHVYRNPFTTFDVAGDEYGSPDPVTALTCSVPFAPDLPVVGQATVTYDLPAGEWMLITAATDTPGSESTVGVDSAGTTRSTVGAWTMCGP
jgi:hypothetical protein